jgi:hypothetical protein
MDRADDTLSVRAMSALWSIYVSPNGTVQMRSPEPLLPNLDLLAEVARDANLPPTATNHAVDLIAAVGAPQCIAPLVSMIAFPSPDPVIKFQGVSKAVRCAGLKAVKDAVEALPITVPYDHQELIDGIAGEIAKLTPRDQTQQAARDLLGSKSSVARWVGVETLLVLKSTEDAGTVAALGNDSSKLLGYWGDAGGGKPDPTLGTRAKEVATLLQGK